jgi:hypothetical protein
VHKTPVKTGILCVSPSKIGGASPETFRSQQDYVTDKPAEALAISIKPARFRVMNEPVDIRVIEGRQRAEDLRRLTAGEITPEELQRENSFIWSAADILHVDLTPKGTEESWARIIQNLQQNSENI